MPSHPDSTTTPTTATAGGAEPSAAQTPTAGGATDGVGAVVIRLAGDLDLATRDRALVLLRQAQAGLSSPVLVDLSEVEFIDCSGLAVLLRARADLGDRLLLRAPSVRVQRLLTLTGTSGCFTVAVPT